MAMVTCPNCGHSNVDTAKFCAKCGNKLSPAETVVMGSFDDSAPLPGGRPPAMSAKEQAAFTPPPAAPPPPRPTTAPPPAYTPPSYSPPPAVGGLPSAGPLDGGPSSSGHRFVAMRTIAGLANVLAWLSLALGILSGLFLALGRVLGIGFYGFGFGIFGMFAGLIVGLILGALGWVYWRLLGEGIWLFLDIEANTRRTATALEERRS